MSSTYAWVITQDCLPPRSGKSLEGIRGPSSCHLSREEIVSQPEAKKFRMLDADGVVYVYGWFVDLVGTATGFEPKDDFGEPELGCTDIQYRDGVWKSL